MGDLERTETGTSDYYCNRANFLHEDAMIHLINASDLDQWADRPESKINLPLLVRRLISLSIKGTTEYTVRTETGIQYGGWDGIIRKAEQESFQVPEGDSFWEIGCSQDPKTKANEDYTKRTKETLGIIPANSTYVFVTPRNWAGRDDWSKEKSAEGIWKNVIALDADSLKGRLRPLFANKPHPLGNFLNWRQHV